MNDSIDDTYPKKLYGNNDLRCCRSGITGKKYQTERPLEKWENMMEILQMKIQ